MQAALPFLEIIVFLFKGLLHLLKFFPSASPFLDDEFSEDKRHAEGEVGFPELERGGELDEGGFIEVGETLEGQAGMRRG